MDAKYPGRDVGNGMRRVRCPALCTVHTIGDALSAREVMIFMVENDAKVQHTRPHNHNEWLHFQQLSSGVFRTPAVSCSCLVIVHHCSFAVHILLHCEDAYYFECKIIRKYTSIILRYLSTLGKSIFCPYTPYARV